MTRALTTQQMLIALRNLPPGAAFASLIPGPVAAAIGLILIAHPDIYFRDEYYLLIAADLCNPSPGAPFASFTEIFGIATWPLLCARILALPTVPAWGAWRREDDAARATLSAICDRLAPASVRSA